MLAEENKNAGTSALEGKENNKLSNVAAFPSLPLSVTSLEQWEPGT